MNPQEQAIVTGFGNIIIQNVSGSNIAVNISTNEQFIIPKYLTSYLPILLGEQFVGRSEDLRRLDECLRNSSTVALVQGLGGIGKTSLAKAYVQTSIEEFSHIVWVMAGNGVNEAFAWDEDLHHNLCLNLSEIKDTATRCRTVIRRLSELKGRNLLIIDNAEAEVAEAEFRSILPKPPGWTVLATSRHQLYGFTTIPLDKLSSEDARALFTYYYKGELTKEEWDELYILTEGHTLSLELFAKSLESTFRRMNVAGLLSCLREKRLDDDVLQRKIELDHSQEETTLFIHLLNTFRISDFEEYDIWLLKQFVVLPPLPQSFDQLKSLLNIPGEDENKLNDALLILTKTGWLQIFKGDFSMHKIVQQALYYQLNISIEDVHNLVESITNLLFFDQASHNIVDKFSWITYGKTILENGMWENEPIIGELQDYLSTIMEHAGEFDQSLSLGHLSLANAIKNFGETNKITAIRLNNLGLLCLEISDYNNAYEFLERSLKIGLELFPETDSFISIRKSNLAHVHLNLENFEEAKELFEEALFNNLNYFKDDRDHPHIATSRANLAAVYGKMGRFKEAKELLEAAIKSGIAKFSNSHPVVVHHQSNLAEMLINSGEYVRAKELLDLVIINDTNNFGEFHLKIAKHKSNLALLSWQLKDYAGCKKSLESSLQIYLEYYDEDHPEIAIVRYNLAKICSELGDYSYAKELVIKAITAIRGKLGGQNSYTKTFEVFLSELLEKEKKENNE